MEIAGEDEETDPKELPEGEAVGVASELDARDLRWLAAIGKLLKSRLESAGSYRPSDTFAAEDDISPRVRLALDSLTIAACERAGRILRSDLRDDEGNSQP